MQLSCVFEKKKDIIQNDYSRMLFYFWCFNHCGYILQLHGSNFTPDNKDYKQMEGTDELTAIGAWKTLIKIVYSLP
jgi:hypothetical protein